MQDLTNNLEQALRLLKKERGEKIVGKLRPILFSNLDRGRIQFFIDGDQKRVHDYVWLVADCYEQQHVYLHDLQIKRLDSVWRPLRKKLQKWSYKYFIRINFLSDEETWMIAHSQATEAAISILSAHFPYDTDFDAWAHVIVYNSCRRHVRQSTKKSQIPKEKRVEVDKISNLADESMGNMASSSESRIDLLKAIEKLPESRKQVIIMLYFEELTPNQVAQKLNKTVSAIYSLHFNALKQLRKILDENGNKHE